MLVAVAVAETAPEITVAEINLSPIWDVVSRLRVGRAGYAYVVDAGGRLIAHPDMSIVLQNRDLSDTSQVKAARLEGKAEATGSASFTAAEGLGGRKVLAVSVPIPHLHWLVFIEQPLDEVLGSLRTQLWRAAALMVLGLALSVLASVLLARRMVAPIRQLQEGAARVGKGELDHRIDIHTGDELEALAAEFNHTTAQLQDSQSNLEQKVEARTADLTAVARAADGNRARSCRVISELADRRAAGVRHDRASARSRLCDGRFCAVFEVRRRADPARGAPRAERRGRGRRANGAFPLRARVARRRSARAFQDRCRRTYRGRRGRPGVWRRERGPREWLPRDPRRAPAARGPVHRRDRRRPRARRGTFTDSTGRSAPDLRRPGGDRDRERARCSRSSRRAPRSSRARSRKCARSAKSARRSARRSTSRPCW